MVLASLLVVACTGYAAWALMPVTLRRRLAAAAGKPLATTGGGCGGCDGCGSATPASGAANLPEGSSVIRIVRQPPRG
jgi:hypothetical protein